MRVFHARVRAQPAAHLEPGKVIHHPVDEGADGTFDQPPRAVGKEACESITQIAIVEVGKIARHRVGQEYIDRSHAAVTPPVGAAMPQSYDLYVTPKAGL